jgi:hypothetical protein
MAFIWATCKAGSISSQSSLSRPGLPGLLPLPSPSNPPAAAGEVGLEAGKGAGAAAGAGAGAAAAADGVADGTYRVG